MRRVFLDCGAHMGESVRLFWAKYPEAETYEVFCFEPQTLLFPSDLLGHVTLFQSAVTAGETPVQFYPARASRSGTICRNKLSGGVHYDKPRLVPATWLSDFLRCEFQAGDLVVLKLDIEGAEYSVLPDLIETGAIRLVADLYVDFHLLKLDPPPYAVHEKILADLTATGLKPKRWDPLTGYIEGITQEPAIGPSPAEEPQGPGAGIA